MLKTNEKPKDMTRDMTVADVEIEKPFLLRTPKLTGFLVAAAFVFSGMAIVSAGLSTTHEGYSGSGPLSSLDPALNKEQAQPGLSIADKLAFAAKGVAAKAEQVVTGDDTSMDRVSEQINAATNRATKKEFVRFLPD